MKRSTEIKNLPVFSIMDGKEVGKVRDLLINADKAMAEYLILETESLHFGIKAIPFDNIEGIGDFAVTIDSEAAVIELSDTPAAHDMLTKNIQIINNKVMTRQGSLVGTVSEYYISQTSGKILGCVLEQAGEADSMVMVADSVLTFGKEVIVVSEDIKDKLMNFDDFARENGGSEKKSSDYVAEAPRPSSQDSYATPDRSPEPEVKKEEAPEARPAFNERPVNPIAPSMDMTRDNILGTDRGVANTLFGSPDAKDVAKQFEDRQILFLKGKQLNRDFVDDNGQIVFRAGTYLNEDQIKRVIGMGSNKLLELSMSVND